LPFLIESWSRGRGDKESKSRSEECGCRPTLRKI